MWWRASGYLAALLPVVIVVLSLSMFDSAKWEQSADWKTVLMQAEAAWKNGDLHKARSLYSHVGRVAFWHRDWEGVLAGACGIKKIDRGKSAYAVHDMLVQAMIAAEIKQSRAGITAAARAFKALGEDKAAAMALSRIQPDWPEGAAEPYKSTDCQS